MREYTRKSKRALRQKIVKFFSKMEPRLKIIIMAVINIASSALRSVDMQQPLVIGHRGSSGMYPEHTALAYR